MLKKLIKLFLVKRRMLPKKFSELLPADDVLGDNYCPESFCEHCVGTERLSVVRVYRCKRRDDCLSLCSEVELILY